jgi:hypothetical protein
LITRGIVNSAFIVLFEGVDVLWDLADLWGVYAGWEGRETGFGELRSRPSLDVTECVVNFSPSGPLIFRSFRLYELPT